MASARKRQRPRRSKAQKEPSLYSGSSSSTSLFWIDAEPIRREWRLRYAEIEKELAELSESTEEYHLRALPAYQSWVAREFGNELSELRILDEKLRESELLFQATLAEAEVSDLLESEAYRIVLERKRRGEDPFPSESPEDSDWDEGWSEVDPHQNYQDEGAEDLFNTESFFGKKENKKKDEQQLDLFSDTKDPIEAQKSLLKTLYRKLVFALHPDTNPDQTDRERKIWTEVQEAYSERDLDRLEMLVAWVESGLTGGLERITHLGTLQAFVLEKLRELRAIRSKFKRLRKERAWKFWKHRDSERTLQEIRELEEADIVREFLATQRSLREFERQFGLWTNYGAKRRPRR